MAASELSVQFPLSRWNAWDIKFQWGCVHKCGLNAVDGYVAHYRGRPWPEFADRCANACVGSESGRKILKEYLICTWVLAMIHNLQRWNVRGGLGYVPDDEKQLIIELRENSIWIDELMGRIEKPCLDDVYVSVQTLAGCYWRACLGFEPCKTNESLNRLIPITLIFLGKHVHGNCGV